MDSASLTPVQAGSAPAPEPPPAYRLFNENSVLIASVLGSPVAGATLIAMNFRRMGKRQKAIGAVAIGIALTVQGSPLG